MRIFKRSFLSSFWKLNGTHYGLLIIGVVLCFWKLGSNDVYDWDEARRGMNAIGMAEHQDFLNLYYGNEPDGMAAKPPLSIWWIHLNFQLFGYSTWSLRLHSAISMSLFFVVFWFWLKRFMGKEWAFWGTAIAISLTGFIGFHTGRTGDTDALLTFLMSAGALCALGHMLHHQRWQLALSALLFGLAFYTKGPAIFLYLPGIVAFGIIYQPRSWWQKREVWMSITIFLLIAGSWILQQYLYGHKNLEEGFAVRSNSLKQMFWYDVVERFTSDAFDHNQKEPFALFKGLDVMYGIWVYVFYLVVAFGLWLSIKGGFKTTRKYLQERPLLLLSIIQVVIIGVIYSLSSSKHRWYLTPFLPYFIIITLFGLQHLFALNKNWRWPVLGLATAAIVLRFVSVNKTDSPIKNAFLQQLPALEQAQRIAFQHQPRQSHYLYTKWFCPNAEFLHQKRDPFALNPQEWLYGKKEAFSALPNERFHIIYLEEYVLIGPKATSPAPSP